MKFIITTSPGLEAETANEIRELTGIGPEVTPAGVLELKSDILAVHRILCGSFLSSRVLYPLAEFHAWEKEVLYTETKNIAWENVIAEGETFVCDVHGKPENCDYSAAQGLLKIKDAIVDRIREKRGNRPDVDKDNPTHQIEMFFWKGKVEISVDLAGEPLHRRAYRKQHGAAPLRESRAAALLRMAQVMKGDFEYLMDPFCGSGTIAVEAAMMLRKIPPANKRYIPKKSFVPNFHKDYLATLTEMRAGILENTPVKILGGDIDSSVIPRARKAAASAGVDNDIQFEVIDFEEIDFKVDAPTLLVSNPPYGERLEDEYEAKQILSKLGRKIKFSSDVERMALLIPKGMENTVGLKPSKKVAWKAGPLDLVAATYDLWKGSRRVITSVAMAFLFTNYGFAISIPGAIGTCVQALKVNVSQEVLQVARSQTRETLNDWLAKKTYKLVTTSESQKRDTLFLRHRGVPHFLNEFKHEGRVLRHYFKTKEQLQSFLENPRFIVGKVPYRKLPLDSQSKRFMSDTYDDLLGVFLTYPEKDALLVGVMETRFWVEVRFDPEIAMGVLQ